MKRWIYLLLLLLSYNSFATLSSFKKRFDLQRDSNGELKAVRLKMATKSFSLSPYVSQLRNELEELIIDLRSKDGAQTKLDELEEWMISQDQNKEYKNENISIIRNSLEELKNINVSDVFKKLRDEGIFSKLENEISKVMIHIDPTVIANASDARFFYRKNVSYEVINKVLNFAKKRLSNIPLLNVASVFIVKVHELILNQRTFNQNMLLHYLQNYKAKDLGLSELEIDHIMSSIYESRISAINYMESNTAVATWDNYGANKFFSLLRSANTKIRRTRIQYDEVGKRYNFSFVEVTENGKRVIKNLIDSQHSFTSKSATAYYFDSPKKVKRIRVMLSLAEVGLGFIPLPNVIKSQVANFISSLYESQVKTEGALVGYFESQRNFDMANKVYQQVLNPYLVQ